MKGHIRERSPGRWAIILDLCDPETGKRRRKWHSFKGTKREAQVECARLIGEHKAGRISPAPNVTVAEYLAQWLDHMRAQLTPKSHERYSDLVNKNIAPLIGSIRLTKLQPVMVSQAYGKSVGQRPARRQGRPFSEDGALHAPRLAPGARAGSAVGIARPESSGRG
jgi:hypothetical protein